MQKFIRYITSFSIRTKLIILILAFLCVPFFIFGTLWYEKSSTTLERNAINYSSQLVNQINDHLDSYLYDLERSTFPLITHPLVQKFMSLSPEDTYENIDVNQAIQEELIPNFILGRTDIYSFSIISQKGLVATYGEYTPKELLTLETEFSKKYAIRGLHYIGDKPVLTVVRLFRDTATYTTRGMIVINLRMDKIVSIAEKIELGKTGYIWIIGTDGRIMYHPDRERWGQSVSGPYLADFEDNTDGSFIRTSDSAEDTLVIFNPSSNGTVVSEVPLRELMQDMISIRDFTILGGCLLIGFVLIVLTVYSHYISKNLHNLQRLMNKAENGFLNIKAPEHRTDEIGRLNQSFNKMVTEIRRLIEVIHVSKLREKEAQIRQREATMQALHSQINPHFLYNTLEVINSYAILENVTPISRMATSLAKIFRYSVGNPQQIVELKSEINHIHTYMDIQKERYPYLNVDFQVDKADLERVNGVRLMLQPIIENAIIHGYEDHKLRPQYIGIIGELRQDRYLLRIIDHGGGMPADRMEQHNKEFQALRQESSSDESAFSKIGMRNVHNRIRLHYGEPYGLQIEKSDSEGTIVQYTLPLLNDAKPEPIER